MWEKKKQKAENPTEVEIVFSGVLQPRFSRMTNDFGCYDAWIAFVGIHFQKVLGIFPLKIKPLKTIYSWETKKGGTEIFI